MIAARASSAKGAGRSPKAAIPVSAIAGGAPRVARCCARPSSRWLACPAASTRPAGDSRQTSVSAMIRRVTDPLGDFDLLEDFIAGHSPPLHFPAPRDYGW